MAQARSLSHSLFSAAVAAAIVAGAAGLGGCAASAPARRSLPATPPAAAPAVSYDFAALVLAPFGTNFKEVPVPLTEVLVFHQPDARRTNDDADCFRPNVVVSFLGRAPADHLLCFDHDRLKRIDASVVLPAADAPALFAAACADWRRGNAALALAPDACEGHRGDIAFSAHRTDGADPATATLSITLEAVPPP